MEPIRPSRGKARGRPQFPTIQPGVSSLLNLPPQGMRGPRPTISHPIPSSQQTPVTGSIPWPPRSMPPPTGISQQKAPRPLGPRSEITGNVDYTDLKQNLITGVRISFKFHVLYIHLYVIFFQGAKND